MHIHIYIKAFIYILQQFSQGGVEQQCDLEPDHNLFQVFEFGY